MLEMLAQVKDHPNNLETACCLLSLLCSAIFLPLQGGLDNVITNNIHPFTNSCFEISWFKLVSSLLNIKATFWGVQERHCKRQSNPWRGNNCFVQRSQSMFVQTFLFEENWGRDQGQGLLHVHYTRKVSRRPPGVAPITCQEASACIDVSRNVWEPPS